MKKLLLLLLLTVSLTVTACVRNDPPPAPKPDIPVDKKEFLVEGEDYIDITSTWDGNSFEYNESLWYMNSLDNVPLPDPQVFVEDGIYYIVGTSDRNVNVVDCYVTTDFVTYEPHYGIYNPVLYEGWESRAEAIIYAPEIYCFDGVYYMYYSAKDENQNRRSSVVSANNPLGPYKPIVNGDVDGLNNPLFHNPDYVDRTLDATVFTDDDGKRYMYFTVTEDTQHIVGVELTSPYEADWSTYKKLLVPQRVEPDNEEIVIEWEGYRQKDVQINEAPFMIKSSGKYYLTYSANGCWNKYYNVCYAVSDSPLGDFVKPYEEDGLWTNLLIGCPSTDDSESPVYNQWAGFASGTGHHCFFYSGQDLMIGYHAHRNRDWNSTEYTERYFAFDYVHFDDSGVPFINGPTYSIINLPGDISGFYNISADGKATSDSINNPDKANDGYIVDCYNLESPECELVLPSGKSEIEISFGGEYEIGGIMVYNSAFYDSYIIEIEYIDFGNGNILYYPQFCEDFYVSDEKEFIKPLSCFNVEFITSFTAESVKIGFNLPEGGSINEIVVLGR